MTAFLSRILVAIFFTAVLSAQASEGVMIKSTTKDLQTSKTTETTIYITASKVVMKNDGNDDNSVIFDAATEVFTYVDNSRREYYQFDKATLIQLKEQIKMFAQMMKQFSSQMPAAQRKKIDDLINPKAPAIIEYKNVGSGEKIKSWNTIKYEGYQSGSKIMVLNLATFETLGMEASNFQVLKKMLLYAKENLQDLASLLPTGGALSQFSFNKESPILKEGLPVKSLTYRGAVMSSENIVNSVVLVSISDSEFEVPKGYVRKTIDIQNHLGK